MQRRTIVVASVVLAFVLALAGGALADKPGKGDKGGGKEPAPATGNGLQGGWTHDYTEAPSTQTQSDYYVVAFNDPPAASYAGGVKGLKPTKPPRGEKLNPRAAEVRAYVDHLTSVHASYRGYLSSNAPGAEIVREQFLTANAVALKANGTRPETLQGGPGVRYVTASWLYRPSMTISNGLIDADLVWPDAGGRENAGAGIKVGIIDTGIRDDHEAFACKDDIPHKAYASGGNPPPFGLETIVFNHGTHVAGTAAGCVVEEGERTNGGPTTGTFSGVAPGASLFDYNVFPGFGGGFIAFGGSAFSHDICAAIEDGVADGMDVLNMSLGGGVQGPHDFLAECTDAANAAGVVIAVAAGNSGPGDSTLESPGNAAGALTAGASTNPHFVGISVEATTADNDSVSAGAALGDFLVFGDTDSGEEGGDEFGEAPVTADYTTTTPANGCSAISTDLTDKIALIDRGVCSFSTKIRNAEAAGAVGVLVVNNFAGDPVAMAHDGLAFPTIPAAMLGKDDGNAIKPAGTVTVDGTSPREFLTENADIIAGFSSRGPTPFTYLIKPDLTAPGVNVYSSVFNELAPTELGYAYFQGTSMATPHLAGSAALLLDLHPDWTPEDVKSALVNTAARVVTDHVNAAVDPGVLARGGGRADLDAANNTPVLISPASASFGLWKGSKPVSGTIDLTLRGASVSCGVSVTNAGGRVTASASMITATPGGATLTLTLNGGGAAQTPSGDYSGDVVLSCGGTELKVPWWTRVDRGGKP